MGATEIASLIHFTYLHSQYLQTTLHKPTQHHNLKPQLNTIQHFQTHTLILILILMSITEEFQAKAHQAEAKPSPSSKRGSRKCDSTFHGVRKRSWGRYVSEIRLPGQKTRIWLGSFGSAEMAARAYDSAAFFLKGSSATLNFPEQVESLPRPLSSSRRDIQSAAAKAALQLERRRQLPSDETKTTDDKNDSVEMMEWWEWEHTTSFRDLKDAPIISPLTVGPTFEDLTWSEVFNFNDDILTMPFTPTPS